MKTKQIIYVAFAVVVFALTSSCRHCICASDDGVALYKGEDSVSLPTAQKWIDRYEASNGKKNDSANTYISNAAAILLLSQSKDVEGIFFQKGINDNGVECTLAFAGMKQGIYTAPLVYVLAPRSCVCVPCCFQATLSPGSTQ